MKISIILKSILVFLSSIGLIEVTLHFYKSSNIETIFLKSEKMTSRSEIEAKIGKPDSIESCGENLWWGGDQKNQQKNNGECLFWVRYNLYLEAYAFGYSSSGRLVSKYHYVSE